MINDYRNIAGDSTVQRIMNDFSITYNRKTSFLDELN